MCVARKPKRAGRSRKVQVSPGSRKSSAQKEDELSLDFGTFGTWLREKWYIPVAVVVILFLIAVNLYYLNYAKKSAVSEDTVAVVNGQNILLQELEDRYRLLGPDLQATMSKEQFLEQLIEVKLLVQEAKRLGINVSDVQVISAMNQWISLQRSQMGVEEFDKTLQGLGMTLEEYVSLNFEPLREQLIINQLLNDNVLADVTVDEEQLHQAYERNMESFMAPPQAIRARHILLKTEEEARAVIQRLDAGEDFAILALNLSLGPSSKYGGDLGFINVTSVVPEFARAAFALQVGEYTKEPVQTEYGWHVIKREADIIPFEEVREYLRVNELAAAKNQAVNDYVQMLRDTAAIMNYYAASKLPENKDIVSFTLTGQSVCLEDGMPLVVMYTTSDSTHGAWVVEAFKDVVKEYEGKVSSHIYVMDTGDDLMTDAVESAVPQSEIQRFYTFNKEGRVPTFLFGCEYIRVGTYWESTGDIEAEKKEFRAVMDEMAVVV